MMPYLSSGALAIDPGLRAKSLRVLADASIMPAAMVFLSIFSWLIYPVPYQPALLTIALAIATFRGGLRIGVLSAAMQMCYAAYWMNGGITDFALDDESKRRLVGLLIIVSPIVLLVAKLRSVISQRDKSLRDAHDRLRAIAGSTSDLVAVFDVDDRRVFTSKSYAEAFDDVALGETVRFDLFHGEDRQRAKDAYLALKEGGETSIHEYRVTLRGRAEAWVEMRGQAVRDEGGKVIYVVLASRDITRAKQSEKALDEERKRLLLIAETIDEAFWIYDPASQRLVYASVKWVSVFDVDPHGLHSFDQMLAQVHPDDAAKVRDSLEMKSSVTPFHIEYRMLLKDGNVRWIRSKGGPVLISDRSQLLVVGASSDITARKAIEERLQQAEKLEALAQMARQVAHDFNNLLAIILGNLDEIEAGLPNNENVIGAQSATLRGAKLTNQLLAEARQYTSPASPARAR